jgi:hypothetical protein
MPVPDPRANHTNERNRLVSRPFSKVAYVAVPFRGERVGRDEAALVTGSSVWIPGESERDSGMPFGFIPDLAFGFAGIPTSQSVQAQAH